MHSSYCRAPRMALCRQTAGSLGCPPTVYPGEIQAACPSGIPVAIVVVIAAVIALANEAANEAANGVANAAATQMVPWALAPNSQQPRRCPPHMAKVEGSRSRPEEEATVIWAKFPEAPLAAP